MNPQVHWCGNAPPLMDAGDYPSQSQPGQGLPAWTSRPCNIRDEDIVPWYTMGFHHMPPAR